MPLPNGVTESLHRPPDLQSSAPSCTGVGASSLSAMVSTARFSWVSGVGAFQIFWVIVNNKDCSNTFSLFSSY